LKKRSSQFTNTSAEGLGGNVKLVSQLDHSVNFVTPSRDGGFYESRFVYRGTDYFICYLSSHSGCALGCQMCHLTQTQQTMMRPATTTDYILQADKVLGHALEHFPNIRRVTFSFMARGEPLANPTILNDSTTLFTELADLAREALGPVLVNFSVSTVMPNRVDLCQVFPVIHPRIYFSAYSADDQIRKQLVPNGIPFQEAADRVLEYTKATGKLAIVHGAFIKGVNDDIFAVEKIAQAFHRGLIGANIVRYNPPDNTTEETSEERLHQIKRMYGEWLKGPVKLVERVGFDVKASCGMFVKKENVG
jgi:23S rRNA (adenine2503-C2)-methyltransferase